MKRSKNYGVGDSSEVEHALAHVRPKSLFLFKACENDLSTTHSIQGSCQDHPPFALRRPNISSKQYFSETLCTTPISYTSLTHTPALSVALL